MPSISEKQMEERLTEAGNRLLRHPPPSSDELLPILDQIEELLSKVEQSPSKSMQTALSPLMKAMVVEDLLRHSDSDVRAGIGACISEITRITAPDSPYDDEKMKDIFQLIVSAFQNLPDTSSRSHVKRVTILETLAKVRSCVVMLDLECEELIIEMFQHFLKSIRDDHDEVIFSSMETIMTILFDESEDITDALIYPILATLKRDNGSSPPIARKLAERVLLNCADKIKPYMLHAIKSLDATTDDYADVVASVCGVDVIVHRNNNQNIFEEQPVPKDGRDDKDLTLSAHPNLTVDSSSGAEDNMTVAKSDSHDSDAPKSGNLEERKDHFEPEKGPENCESPGDDMDVSQGQCKDIEVVKPLKEVQDTAIHLPLSTAFENEVVKAASPTNNDSTPDGSQSGNDRADVMENLEEETTSDGQNDGRSDVEAAGEQRSGEYRPDKRSPEEKPLNQEESIKDASDSDSEKMLLDQKKNLGNASNEMEDGSSLNKKRGKKSVRAKPRHEKQSPSSPIGENNVKVMHSTIKSTKDEDNETPRMSTKRKRTPSTEKASKKVDYGKDIVGSKVKVWWPRDQMYYEGVIASFDSVRKKHKILYADGDEEKLNLKNQQWEFVTDDSVVEGDQAVEPSSRDASSDLQRTKKAKANLETSSERNKIDVSPKRKRKETAKSPGTEVTGDQEPKAKKASAKSKPKGRKKSLAKSNLKSPKKSEKESAKASSGIKSTPSSSNQGSQKTAKSKGKNLQSTEGRMTRSATDEVIKTSPVVLEQKSPEKTTNKKNSAAKSRQTETSKKGRKRKSRA